VNERFTRRQPSATQGQEHTTFDVFPAKNTGVFLISAELSTANSPDAPISPVIPGILMSAACFARKNAAIFNIEITATL
jgi:hypothetical protein